jgi:predicted nucleic acid-binding Zn ribbon protein
MKTCNRCFRPIPSDAVYCHHCGDSIYSETYQEKLKRFRKVMLWIVLIALLIYLSSCVKESKCTSMSGCSQPREQDPYYTYFTPGKIQYVYLLADTGRQVFTYEADSNCQWSLVDSSKTYFK